jgi:hypothetical protein
LEALIEFQLFPSEDEYKPLLAGTAKKLFCNVVKLDTLVVKLLL